MNPHTCPTQVEHRLACLREARDGGTAAPPEAATAGFDRARRVAPDRVGKG